jgi:uncharacterized membrane-anchored protein
MDGPAPQTRSTEGARAGDAAARASDGAARSGTRARSGNIGPPTAARHALSKVPEITVIFWVVKVLTTGMGESTSDYLTHALNPAIAVFLGLIALAGALALQFRARRYEPWIYWLAVAMVAVFGTMAADALHVELGVPYVASTAFYLIVLGIIFRTWFVYEKTLSIHSIFTTRRELFYWATVLATFALGTAAGDMTATTLGLGYFASGVLFAVLIAIPAVGYLRFDLNAVFAFWLAYVLTRPLGASFADWLAVSHKRGGLALGTGPVSVALALVIVGFVAYLARTHVDVEDEHLQAHEHDASHPHVRPVLDPEFD